MPDLPCECESGHQYSRAEAAKLKFKCKLDGTLIKCEAATGLLAAALGTSKRPARAKATATAKRMAGAKATKMTAKGREKTKG